MYMMQQKGRSMVEMLGVLAIIGVLSAAGLKGYSDAMFKHKMNNFSEGINSLIHNMQEVAEMPHENNFCYNSGTLIQLQKIPDAFTGLNGRIYDNFKNELVYYNCEGNGHYLSIQLKHNTDGSMVDASLQVCQAFTKVVQQNVDLKISLEMREYIAEDESDRYGSHGYSTNQIRTLNNSDIYNFCQQCLSTKLCRVMLYLPR